MCFVRLPSRTSGVFGHVLLRAAMPKCVADRTGWFAKAMLAMIQQISKMFSGWRSHQLLWTGQPPKIWWRFKHCRSRLPEEWEGCDISITSPGCGVSLLVASCFVATIFWVGATAFSPLEIHGDGEIYRDLSCLMCFLGFLKAVFIQLGIPEISRDGFSNSEAYWYEFLLCWFSA